VSVEAGQHELAAEETGVTGHANIGRKMPESPDHDPLMNRSKRADSSIHDTTGLVPSPHTLIADSCAGLALGEGVES
jgi:hypothetical protein